MERTGCNQHHTSLVKKVCEMIFFALILYILVILQTVWAILPVQAVFVFCVCLCFVQGGIFAVGVSVACGFLVDVASGRVFCSDALCYLYISAGCVWLRGRIFYRKRRVQMLLVFGVSVAHYVLAYGLHGMYETVAFLPFFLYRAVPGALIGAFLSLLFYPAANRIVKGRNEICEESA